MVKFLRARSIVSVSQVKVMNEKKFALSTGAGSLVLKEQRCFQYSIRLV